MPVADYNITAQIKAHLEQYSFEVKESMDQAAEECAKGMVKDLKADSPKQTGGYAKTWTRKAGKAFNAGEGVQTVFNSKNYQRTHLLEKPHAGPFGKGLVAGQPHIGPAEKKWNEEFQKQCEEACKR